VIPKFTLPKSHPSSYKFFFFLSGCFCNHPQSFSLYFILVLALFLSLIFNNVNMFLFSNASGTTKAQRTSTLVWITAFQSCTTKKSLPDCNHGSHCKFHILFSICLQVYMLYVENDLYVYSYIFWDVKLCTVNPN
jgi:hypothetical protein